MRKKTWLVIQLTSMLLLFGGCLSIVYFSNEHASFFRETLLQNHFLVTFLLLIFLGMGYLIIIAEVKIRTGKITKMSSLITIGVLCIFFLIAYLSD